LTAFERGGVGRGGVAVWRVRWVRIGRGRWCDRLRKPGVVNATYPRQAGMKPVDVGEASRGYRRFASSYHLAPHLSGG
jgi:hypothetical protein